MRLHALFVGIALSACTTVTPLKPSAADHGDPRGSVSFDALVAAQELLDRALHAHGGAAFVSGERRWRVGAAGNFDFQGHFARPWASSAYAVRSEVQHAPGVELVTVGQGGPFAHTAWLAAERGVWSTADRAVPLELSQEETAELREEDLMHLPWFHLARAVEHAGTLTEIPGPADHAALRVTLADGARWTLLLDRETHLLARAERLAHWPGKGDRLDWVAFQDYAPRHGIPVPAQVRWHREALTTQLQAQLNIESFELDQPIELNPSSALGELPALLPAPPASPLTSHALGAGVFILDLPSVDGRVLLVDLGDHAAVIESGATSENGRAILATAAELLPDKPVRYLAMSHHHRISAQGLRPYVQQGVTLLATPGNVDYLRDLATRPYRIAPDAQQRAPREPVIQLIGTRHVLGTGQLELHTFATSGHTDEYVLSWIPALRLGVVGDLVGISHTPETQKAGARTQAMYDVIVERGLDVQAITQTWPLDERYARIPFDWIRATVERARR